MNALILIAATSMLYAVAGEWVTRENTGEKVCQLTRDLHRYDYMRHDWCENWMTEPPAMFTRPPSNNGWMRCPKDAACKLHFEDGWR